MRRTLAAFTSLLLPIAALSLAGCDEKVDVASRDAGCTACDCCDSSQVCLDGQCCTPSCRGKNCGSDGCGGSCGACEAGWTCNADRGTCECALESATAFCTRKGVVCGTLSDTDLCGARRVVDCDLCPAPKTCDTATGTCEPSCDPEDDPAFCRRLQKTCGSVADDDNCGHPRTVDCGTCAAPRACDLTTHTCTGCEPEADFEFCQSQNRECGPASGRDRCDAARQVADCGACLTPDRCGADGRCGPCPPEEPADFCARLGDECGSATAPDTCGTERTVDCGRCTLPQVCRLDHTCGTLPVPSNDTCATAELLSFTGEVATVMADTTSAHDDTTASCGGTGKDVVYFFTTSDPALVRIAATALDGSGMHPAVSLRSNCADSKTEGGCAAGSGGSVELTVAKKPAGTYYVWVDGFGGAQGPFLLEVTLVAPLAAPTNDTCATPIAVTFDPTGTASFTGDTLWAADDATGSCAAFAGGDVVYAVVLPEDAAVAAQVSAIGFSPGLYLRRSCASSAADDESACAKAATGSAEARLSAPFLAAGTWYLVVDGASGGGPYSLEVTRTAAIRGDRCATAAALSPDPQTGVATVTGDTTALGNDASGSCTGIASADVVYSLTLSQPKDAAIVLTPGPSSLLKAGLYLQSSCGGTELLGSCGFATAIGASVRRDFRFPTAGTWYIWVDGYGATEGDFTLTVTLTDPPTNDNCAQPEPIAIDTVTGIGVAHGDTTLMSLDGTGSCGGSGGDLTYAFTTSAIKDVEIVMAPAAGASLKPSVYVRGTCALASSERACASPSGSGQPARLALPHLPAGTWYIWADSQSGTVGAFTLTVTTVDPFPAPANDACAGAVALSFDPLTGIASENGSTVGATDDSGASAACATASAPHTGPDVVYAFSLTAPAQVAATVTRDPAYTSYRPAVYIRSGCLSADPLEQRGCGVDSAGRATATALNLAAGNYYVVVDGLSGTSGEFTLSVERRAPVARDADCTGPIPVVFDANGLATLSGDTALATNHSGSLGCPGVSGADLVYRIDTTGRGLQSLVATVTFTGPTVPAQLYLRSTVCDSADPSRELACRRGTGATAALAAPGLAEGTYFLWVDTASTSASGAFDLTLTLTPAPPPPPNHGCANAAPLTFSNGRVSLQADSGSAPNDTSGTCGALIAGEVVYTLTVPPGADAAIDARVKSLWSGTGFEPALYLRSACASADAADQLACATSRGDSAWINVPRAAPGTYYLFVDGTSLLGGAFDLEVALSAARALPDACAAAWPVVFDAAGLARVTGDTTLASDDAAGVACPGATGNDLVYSIDTTGLGPKDLSARLRFASTSVYPALHLRSVCNSSAPADELACRRGSSSPLSLSLFDLAPGVYYLWVDTAYAADKGPFTLDLQLATPPPPPGNDTCATAQALSFAPMASGTVSQALVDSTTRGATDGASGSCATMSGPDVVYTFSVGSAASLIATVSRDGLSGSYSPALVLRRACASAAPADQLACAAAAGTSGTATLALGQLPAGTYYLLVDGTSGTAGNFSLVAQLGPAVDNDGCSSPRQLVFDAAGLASADGDTTLGLPDATGSCGSTGSAPDLVYSFTLNAPKDVSAVLRPSSSLRGALYLRPACDQAATERSCRSAASAGAPVALSMESLAAGTWYLWVDGYDGSTGSFTLQLAATTPPPPPPNEDCASPEPLVFDASGHATASGNTANGRDDASGCVSSTSPDAVYSFTLSAPKRVEVTLSPSGALQGVVYLRSSCSLDTAEVGCQYSSTPGTVVRLQAMPRLAEGTWYLWVDGFAGTKGAYTLEVEAIEPLGRPPSNDSCASPEPLVLDPTSGKAYVTGASTSDSVSRYLGTCGASGAALTGPDLVYSFTLSAAATVSAKVTRDASTGLYRPAVYLRAVCDSPLLADEAACARESAGVATASASLPAGTFYVIVDGVAGSAGVFDLELTRSAARPGDNCLTALPLTLNGGTATVSGDTGQATNSGDGTCATASGSDLVYQLDLTRESNVEVKVSPTSPTMRPAVYLRRACSDASPSAQAACLAAPTAGTPVDLLVPRLAAGTWYLWVDAATASASGPFTLEVTVSTAQGVPPNDACVSPEAILLDAVGNATINADTTGASNDATGTCGAANGADLVYALTLPAPSSVTARVTRKAASPGYRPAIYLRSDCESALPAHQQGCALDSSGVATLTAANLAAGTYYLFVDGTQSTFGGFTLEVSAPGPLNNDCYTARTIPTANGTLLLNGDTTQAVNNTKSLISSWGDGPDVVYTFTTAVPKTLTASLKFSGTQSNVLYLRRVCDTTVATDEVVEAHALRPGPAAFTYEGLPAGTYWLWVDEGLSEKGTFTLTVTFADPPPPQPAPANDACAGAQLLVVDPLTDKATVTGAETTWASDDAAGTCEATQGPDVVYRVTTSATAKMTITATRDGTTPSFNPVVYLRSQCAGSLYSDELTCSRSSSGVATAVVNAAPPGTYYVWVDGAGISRGKFDLVVELGTALSGPANDSCGSVEALRSAASTSASGTTIGAQNQITGSCAYASAGDVVYSFTLSQAQKVTATVTPTAQSKSYVPAVYLRKTCGASPLADELACGKASTGGAAATAVVKRAPAGTYFVWVDGGTSAGATGNFDLLLTLDSPVAPPTNDTCAGAQPLSLSTLVNGSTEDADDDYTGSLSLACGAKRAAGQDVVYSFAPATSASYRVTVTPQSGFDVSIWVTAGSCGMPSDCAFYRDNGTLGQAEVLTFSAMAGTIYYIVVDSYSASYKGSFTIKIDP